MPIHEDLYNTGTRKGQCPECGAELRDLDLRAHAALHYGDEPLPVTHRTRLARQRYAVILGEQPPEY